jgi:hypothetical protein
LNQHIPSHESRKGIFDWSLYGLKDEDGE